MAKASEKICFNMNKLISDYSRALLEILFYIKVYTYHLVTLFVLLTTLTFQKVQTIGSSITFMIEVSNRLLYNIVDLFFWWWRDRLVALWFSFTRKFLCVCGQFVCWSLGSQVLLFQYLWNDLGIANIIMCVGIMSGTSIYLRLSRMKSSILKVDK